MTPATPGTYTIGFHGAYHLTLLGGHPNDRTQVVLLPPRDAEKEQHWQVEARDDGAVTLENVASGTYLGHDGDPAHLEIVHGHPQPHPWRLRPAPGRKGAFHLVLPGGPVDGTELAVDLHPLRLYPPLLGLLPLREADLGQTWTLTPV
ncbi:RICIN domain-containing protein [Streptomyces macrosporus]|uniref:Ricin B lectin domain-containing protein n=1 Tax=Streptomyces macrosporus TaxID=44032 RepID=A0ABN3JLR6_9ACTN